MQKRNLKKMQHINTLSKKYLSCQYIIIFFWFLLLLIKAHFHNSHIFFLQNYKKNINVFNCIYFVLKKKQSLET